MVQSSESSFKVASMLLSAIFRIAFMNWIWFILIIFKGKDAKLILKNCHFL
jgi:hypothetical protein